MYKNFVGDPIGCHNRFIEMRNKYFAHDENNFKIMKVGAVLDIDNQKLTSIIYPKKETKFDYDINISILHSLCQKTKEWTLIQLEKEINRVKQDIEKRGFDVLNGYKDLNVYL